MEERKRLKAEEEKKRKEKPALQFFEPRRTQICLRHTRMELASPIWLLTDNTD